MLGDMTGVLGMKLSMTPAMNGKSTNVTIVRYPFFALLDFVWTAR